MSLKGPPLTSTLVDPYIGPPSGSIESMCRPSGVFFVMYFSLSSSRFLSSPSVKGRMGFQSSGVLPWSSTGGGTSSSGIISPRTSSYGFFLAFPCACEAKIARRSSTMRSRALLPRREFPIRLLDCWGRMPWPELDIPHFRSIIRGFLRINII